MRGVGLPEGTRGVLEAYRGHIDRLIIDASDEADVPLGADFGVHVEATDTRLTGPDAGRALVSAILEDREV
jgi:hypothetical protein